MPHTLLPLRGKQVCTKALALSHTALFELQRRVRGKGSFAIRAQARHEIMRG